MLAHLLEPVGIDMLLRGRLSFFSFEQAGDKNKEHRDKNEIDESSGEHTTAHSGADGIHGAGAGAGSDGQRQHTEEESQRSHDNRPESRFDGAKGCIHQVVSMPQPFLDKLNDQDGIFC